MFPPLCVLRVFRVPPVATLNPVNPINPVKNQPVPHHPLRTGCLTPWRFVRTQCGNQRFAGGAASCRAAFWSCLLLPLLGVSEFWRTGGFSSKGRKGTQKTRNPVKFAVSYCHETLTTTTRCRSLSRGRLRPFQASWVSIFRTCQKISPLQKSGISHGSRGENRFVLLSWHVASIRSDKCDNLDR